MRDDTHSFPPYAVTLGTTFWFDDETTPNMNLAVSKPWLDSTYTGMQEELHSPLGVSVSDGTMILAVMVIFIHYAKPQVLISLELPHLRPY